ncbi:MAG TPA: diacylglycerol kinase family protein [Thermoanaerobaculia bacterium]|nr:diacylglycerol kinase family protein [Thermoanaerobaculia bacterium]
MPAKGILFLNRNSGAKLPPGEIDALREETTQAGIEIVELSKEIDCAQEIRARARRGVKLFLAGGGDGTIHHVLQAVVQTDSVLAVLPLGTYNHFARDLGIPLDWREALDVALNGASRQVDTARINDRFFVNNVSIGLYPELVAKREERGRDYPRWKARLLAVYTTLRKYPHVTLHVETQHHNEVLRTHVFMISNNRYDLERVGIEAPRETLTEGKLSVYWLQHTSRLRMTRFLVRYATGHVRAVPGFTSFKTVRMRVQTPRPHLKVGIDGELFTMQTPLVVTAVPQSLLVKVPRTDASG